MGAVLGAADPDQAGGVAVLGSCWFLVLVGFGLWLVIAPRKAWRFRHTFSLMYQDPDRVEPSSFAIVYYRVAGVVSILLGIGAAVLVSVVLLR